MKQRIHLIIFIVSVLCLSIVGIHIWNADLITVLSQYTVILLCYQFVLIVSGLFVIFILPSYPIFFIILRNADFNILERICLMSIINLSFYIIIGYVGHLLAFAITNIFFFISLLLTYSMIVGLSLIYAIKKTFMVRILTRYDEREKQEFIREFSITHYFKRVELNGILIGILLFLLCIFNLAASRIFSGTDPWLHISIVKLITEINYLPLEEYLGNVGLHIIGALFYFFSGVEYLILPQFYVFFSVPMSGLVVYILFMRIFKNKNLAILGVLIAEISSLGYGQIMHQYWAVTLALMQSLLIFYLLFMRIGIFIEQKELASKTLLRKMGTIYPLILILFVSSLFTHSLVTMIFLISYLWIFLIYFLKDYRRAIDFIFLGGLAGIFLLCFLFDFATGHFSEFNSFFTLPIYYYFFGLIALGVCFFPIIRSFIKNITFAQKELLNINYSLLENYKSREIKVIIPLSIFIVGLFTFIFFLGNIFLFQLSITTILVVIEIIIFAFFSVWGYIFFQKSTKGKFLFIWLVGLGFLMAFGLLFDLVVAVEGLWLRILHMASPVILIGFISYIYKLIKIKAMHITKIKVYIIIIIIFSFFSSLTELTQFCREDSLNRREASVSKWYHPLTTGRNGIIAKYGYYYTFLFNGYPYYLDNENLMLNDIMGHLILDDNFALPENHVKLGINILQGLKNIFDKELYILLPSEPYQTFESFSQIYGYLHRFDLFIYYNLPYLNRIFSAKDLDLIEDPLYWVI